MLMRTPALALSFALISAVAGVTHQNPPAPPPQTPTFRAGVDLVQLDVSVLDKNRQPVHGLTAKDFTILENGKPQPIQVFTAVDLLDEVATTTAAWQRDVTPDVTTNAIPNAGRVFLLVLDDALMPLDAFAINATLRAAESVVSKMRADDLAGVVFTRDGKGAQGLTSDRTRLLTAIRSMRRTGNTPLGTMVPVGPSSVPTCNDYMASIMVVQDAADFLIALPQRRKSLVYISGGMGIDLTIPRISGPIFPRGTANECGATVVDSMYRLFTNAQRSNVTVYGVDPMGLRASGGSGVVDWLQTVSDNTGGHAIVNTNDFEPGITQMFRENSSYYLVGYQPTDVKPDSVRRIEVKVDRPDVEVRTKRNYYAPRTSKAKAEPPPAVAALAEIVPKTDWPIRIAIAPFLSGTNPVATIALGVEHAGTHDRLAEKVDVLVSAFTPEGDARGSISETIPVTLPPSRDGDPDERYDLLASLPLKPGRYQLRVSAHGTTRDIRGSVYADVDVPDFSRAPLSLSGVLVTVAPAPLAAPRLVLSPIVPVVPTSERTFAKTDKVTTFLRVYQGTNAEAATLTVRVVDAHDQTVATQTMPISAALFRERHVADVPYALPMARFAPGDFLLTFEVSAGKATARRDVRFTVR